VPPVEQLAERLAAARRVAVLTGAGLSAASGIPTFRGADGLWKTRQPETIATPEAFENDPRLVWEWYDWRRGMIRETRPNPAHEVLARWAAWRPGVTVITQNVDGLLERAGVEPIRLHGSLWLLRCWQPCAAGRVDWHDDTTPLPTLPPRCPHCGGLARPAVTWFGEPLDAAALDAAARAAADADVFLTIGTSAAVFPAASLLPLAYRHGAFTAEINTDVTHASGVVHLAIRGRAEEVLPKLEEMLQAGFDPRPGDPEG
jgi:NAD-dependent protein deacetylase/lipoamidase